MKNNQRFLQHGFTLVELSIVLVIIGLIIGGVLVGQDLIKASQIRSVFKEKEQLETGINTFKLKYNCLPGDCINISQQLSGATDGDGDGKVYGTTERTYLFDQLLRANLIAAEITNPGDLSTYTINGNPGTVAGFNVPASKYTAAGYVYHYVSFAASNCGTTVSGNSYSPAQCNRHNIVFMGSEANSGGPYSVGNPANMRPFPCSDVYQIDSKYDDGLPFTGQIVLPGHNYSSHVCSSGGYPTGVYQNISTENALFSFITNDR